MLATGHSNGAYYLAGYAVECALKACIAKQTQRHEFPAKRRVDASYTHSLKELVKVAKLSATLFEKGNADVAFRAHWDVVQFWSEQNRYGKHSPQIAQAFVNAIEDKKHGVLAWIKQIW